MSPSPVPYALTELWLKWKERKILDWHAGTTHLCSYSQLCQISQVLGWNHMDHFVEIKSIVAVLTQYSNSITFELWEWGEELYQLLSLTQQESIWRGTSVWTHDKRQRLAGDTDRTERTHQGQHVHTGLWCCLLQCCPLVWKLTWIYNATQP